VDTLNRPVVEALLIQRNYGELSRLVPTDKRYWYTLNRFLNEKDGILRWRAIESVGCLMNKWWCEGDKEKVREYVRRQLWALNEESGSIGWSAPEIIAETIIHIPELLEPYGSIMLTHALRGEAIIDGVLWAIGRLGRQIREAVASFQDEVLAVFESNNPDILGLAAWAMGRTEFLPALPELRNLSDRTERVRIYIDGDFQEKPLGIWALEAIRKIG
jgi:hypothetical protein